MGGFNHKNEYYPDSLFTYWKFNYIYYMFVKYYLRLNVLILFKDLLTDTGPTYNL